MKLFTKLKESVNRALTTVGLALVIPATALASKPDRSQLSGFGEYSTTAPLDQTIWKIGGAIALLVGMGMAGWALFSVAGALIGEFSDLRSGKGSFGKLITLLVIGVALIILVYFFITKALDLFGVQ